MNPKKIIRMYNVQKGKENTRITQIRTLKKKAIKQASMNIH